MLGMMNCPTDSVEFYSASPAMKRSIEERGSATVAGERLARLGLAGQNPASCSSLNSSSTGSLAGGQRPNADGPEKAQQRAEASAGEDSDSDVVRVFSEARDKPHFVYTSDGRKVMEGQQSPAPRDPVRMWNRLILDSVIASRIDDQRWQTNSTGAAVMVSCVDGHCKLSSAGRRESVNIFTPTVVNAAKPQPLPYKTTRPAPAPATVAPVAEEEKIN